MKVGALVYPHLGYRPGNFGSVRHFSRFGDMAFRAVTCYHILPRTFLFERSVEGFLLLSIEPFGVLRCDSTPFACFIQRG